jgi:hypothetical protein
MQIRATAKDAVIVSTVNQMRQVIKSDASKKYKVNAINTLFWQLMRVLDEMEGGEE